MTDEMKLHKRATQSSYAGYGLACHAPFCRYVALSPLAGQRPCCWLITKRHRSRTELKSTPNCSLLTTQAFFHRFLACAFLFFNLTKCTCDKAIKTRLRSSMNSAVCDLPRFTRKIRAMICLHDSSEVIARTQ